MGNNLGKSVGNGLSRVVNLNSYNPEHENVLRPQKVQS
jgi:hypothetical protein